MSVLYRIAPDRIRGSGTYFLGRAGENLGRYKLVYKAANGAWYLADADLAATMPVVGLTMERVNAGQIVRILSDGFIGTANWTWTTGDLIYASTTAGELTSVAPAPPDLVQVVGQASRTNMIYFNPFPPSEGIGHGLTKEEFYPPVESDAYIGQHYGAQMLDGVDTIVGFEFTVPLDFHSLVNAYVLVVQTTAAAPDMVWSATTDFAEACTTENYNEHQDTTGVQTDEILQSDIVCLDISTALSGIAAGDLVGMEFLRDGDAGGDTVGGPVWCLGVRLRYR